MVRSTFLALFIPVVTLLWQAACVASSDWTMMGYDPQRTSQVTGTTSPTDPTVHCRYKTIHRHEKFYTSPAVVNGTIYAASFISNLLIFGAFPPYDRSEARPLFRWWGDGYLYSINAETCSKKWEFNAGAWIESSPTVADGVVYFGTGDGDFYALNADSGAVIWNYRLPVSDDLFCTAVGFVSFFLYCFFCDNRNFNSSPLVLGESVYFGSRDGHLNVLNRADGTVVARIDVGGDLHSAIAVSADGTRLYGSTATSDGDPNVFAFDVLSGGEILWKATIEGGSYCLSPAVDADDQVYWSSMGGILGAFDGATGAMLWTATMDAPSRSSVSLAKDNDNRTTVYVAGFGSKLYAYDAVSGDELWTTSLQSMSEGVTVVADDGALVGGDYAGYLSKFSATTGSEQWSFCAGDGNCGGSPNMVAIQGTPIVIGDRIYFCSYDGHIYVVKDKSK